MNNQKLSKKLNKILNLQPSPELSYVVGAFIGDGWKAKIKNRKSGNDYRISLASIDKEFVEKFANCMFRVVKRKRKIYCRKRARKKDLFEVTFSSKELFFFLSKNIEKPEIKEVIFQYPKEFLQGIFDAEGSVTMIRGKSPRITLSNTDLKLLQICQDLLNKLGISSRIEKENKKGKISWRIVISRKKDIVEFQKKIGFSIIRKMKKLNLIAGRGFEPRTSGL